MINISDRHQCIFIHIPKCAGTSLKQTLGLPGKGHPPWNWFAANAPGKWNAYLKFTIVRNPWDRFVSAYVYATMKESYWHGERKGMHPDYGLLTNQSFEACCEIALQRRTDLKHESWYPQHLWIAQEINDENRLMVDLVLRYERLEEEMAVLSERLGIESMVLPCINASSHDNYRDFYNEKTRKIIAELYAVDIALLGYTF